MDIRNQRPDNRPPERSVARTGRFIVKLVVVAVVAAGAATLAATAATPDASLKQVATDTGWLTATTSRSVAETVPQPEAVRQQTLAEKADELGTFIGVDLEAMELYWYEDGEVVKTYPVLSKGEPGSRFETPSGQYEISYRNERHLSSIGDVYMPYSQQFYGNFFIHGWPYYPGGERVPDGYSGGCIRLATEDARELFAQTTAGTPIVVVGGTENTAATTTPQVPAPVVNAKAYLVADADSGHVFAAKRGQTTFPIASLTKLMTAVVANETIAYNDPITISQTAVDTYGQAGGLITGERLLLEELYYPLLLESSNDAAEAIAEHYGRDRFIDQMNRKALALDMGSTHFADASGLSDGNASSVRDLFRLARYIHDKKEFIFDITTRRLETIPQPGSDGLRGFTNNNPLVGQAEFAGGKNGYTDNARHTLLSVFETTVAGEKRTVVIIVLGSETHAQDTRRLLGWLKRAT